MNAPVVERQQQVIADQLRPILFRGHLRKRRVNLPAYRPIASLRAVQPSFIPSELHQTNPANY
jgi:hypothetical protein